MVLWQLSEFLFQRRVWSQRNVDVVPPLNEAISEVCKMALPTAKRLS